MGIWSLSYLPETGIAESFSNFMLDFLGNRPTAFQSGNSVLHPHLPRPSVHTLASSPRSLRSVLVVWPSWSGDVLTSSPRPLRSVFLATLAGGRGVSLWL